MQIYHIPQFTYIHIKNANMQIYHIPQNINHPHVHYLRTHTVHMRICVTFPLLAAAMIKFYLVVIGPLENFLRSHEVQIQIF